MSSFEDREIQKALAASDMYQILSISLRFPDERLAKGLMDGSMAEDVCNIFSELEFSDYDSLEIKHELLSSTKEFKDYRHLLDNMKREYTRLFDHPKKPVIYNYETMYLHKPGNSEEKPPLFISPTALHAEKCYEKAGLVLHKDINEPGDHIATEMEFMMYLYSQKAMALEKDDYEEIDRRIKEIKEFEETHLKKWSESFFESLLAESKNETYTIIAKLGKKYMEKTLRS